MFNAAAVGLMLSSAVVAALALVAAAAGVSACLRWNPDDSSSDQLRRERRSFLVESVMGVVLALQAVIFFLFLRTADRIHEQLAGAMCAAGSLAASRFGYPLLALHVSGVVLAATWLLVNRATRTSVETRVVRAKHASLLVVAAVLSAGTALQVVYFADLDPSILTSCCATLFAPEAGGLASALARIPVVELRAAFLVTLAGTLALGTFTLRRSASPVWFALSGAALGAVSVASLVAWIGPDFYGVAAHHCPFCILAGDHHHVGYLLYAALATGVVTSLSSGALRLVRARGLRSAEACLPERRLCRASVVSWVVFALLAWAPVIGDRLSPGGNEDVVH